MMQSNVEIVTSGGEPSCKGHAPCMPNPGRLKKAPPADDKLLEGRFRVELDTPRCFD
jgi:hypothetical protein